MLLVALLLFFLVLTEDWLVINVVDFIGELNPEIASLYPGRLYFRYHKLFLKINQPLTTKSSSTASSTEGIILGGFINGKLKLSRTNYSVR